MKRNHFLYPRTGAGEGGFLAWKSGGKLKGITCQGRGGDMSFGSRDLLAAWAGEHWEEGMAWEEELPGGQRPWTVSPLYVSGSHMLQSRDWSDIAMSMP